MTASETSVDVLARVLAVGGFAINALGFLYLILQGRRKVSVKTENTRRFHAGKDVGTMLHITIVNTGHRVVTIDGVRFDFSDNNHLMTGRVYKDDKGGNYRQIICIYRSEALPKRIEDGDSMNVFLDYDDIGSYMIERGSSIKLENIYAFDAEGKKYKSKVSKWMRGKVNGLADISDEESS